MVKALLDDYDSLPFLLPDGSCDLTPCPKRNLPIFARFGIRADGTRQSTPEMEVFPVEYFCPVAYAGSTCDITPNTYSIHHYHSSWKEKSRAMRFDEEVMEPRSSAQSSITGTTVRSAALWVRGGKNGAPEPSRQAALFQAACFLFAPPGRACTFRHSCAILKRYEYPSVFDQRKGVLHADRTC